MSIFNEKFLDKKIDTPWRKMLNLNESEKPEWRVLYKSALSKRIGDLQWRLLHGAIAVNAFVSVIKLFFLFTKRNCLPCVYAVFWTDIFV